LADPTRSPSAVSIPGAVEGAFGVLWLAWRRAGPALLVASVCLGLWLQLGAAGAIGVKLLGLLIPCLACVAATAAVCRVALGLGGVTPRWGRDEWRVLASGVLMILLAVVLLMLLLVVVLALAYGVASAGKGFVAGQTATWASAVDGRGRVVVGAVALAGMAAIVWVMVRLFLAPAASVARRRVQVLSVWSLTRGMAWRLAAVMVWVGLTPAALLLAIAAASRLAPHDAVVLAWLAHLAQGLVVAAIWLPLKVGVMTYAYPRLAADSPIPSP